MALTTVRPQGMGFNTGRRNLIINGAMQVAQRGTSFATMGEADSQYTLDRFKWQESGTPTFEMTVTQDSSSPDEMGNSKSLKVEVTTADATLGSNERARIEQYIEAQNCQGIRKGTSAAKKLTASFWVKSSKTGTYILELQENDNDRSNSQSYTISSANTWEYKTVTFPADTTGTINNDNGNGITFRMYLCAGTLYTSGTLATSWQSTTSANQAVGQVNLADTANATWFVTGIQLELGENASDFEHRSFDEEMRLCLRYFERFKRSYGDMGQSSSADATLWAGCSRSGNSGNNQGVMRYTRKRNNPSLSVSSATHINSIFPISPFNSTLSGFAISGNAGIDSAFINATNNASSAPGSDCASFVYIPNDSGYLDVDAEL